MSKQAANKAVVGRWFTDFWGKNVNLAVVDEIAAPDTLDVEPPHTFEQIEREHLALLDHASLAQAHDLSLLLQLPTVHAADREAAHIVVVVDGVHEDLQRLVAVISGRRNVLEDGGGERSQIELATLLGRLWE